MTATDTTAADLATGAALLSFTIATTQDAVVEGTENFTVTLANATTVVNPTVTTNITDNYRRAITLNRPEDGCGRRRNHPLHGEPEWRGAWCRPERDVYAG